MLNISTNRKVNYDFLVRKKITEKTIDDIHDYYNSLSLEQIYELAVNPKIDEILRDKFPNLITVAFWNDFINTKCIEEVEELNDTTNWDLGRYDDAIEGIKHLISDRYYCSEVDFFGQVLIFNQ